MVNKSLMSSGGGERSHTITPDISVRAIIVVTSLPDIARHLNCIWFGLGD
jgi:hypothetical protein